MPLAQALFADALPSAAQWMCYPSDSRREWPLRPMVAEAHSSDGGQGVRAEILNRSVRQDVIAILPRLKRFADVLAGEKKEGRALLRRALLRMLKSESSDRRDNPFDRWAFAEIYGLWQSELRHHADSDRETPTENDFGELFAQTQGAKPDALAANFLWQLSPQQRSALLLVYGEGFSHEDAGRVLDTSSDTIQSRLVRASASLADRLSAKRAGKVALGQREPVNEEIAG